MTEYRKVTPDVLKIADRYIHEHHPHLLDVNVGFIFRDKAPTGSGRIVLGTAKKTPPDMLALGFPHHFVITLSYDWWSCHLNEEQQEALIDHELCHCLVDEDGNLSIQRHDVEEFNCVFARHGAWWPGADTTVQAIQAHLLPLPRQGRVEAIEPSVLEDQWTTN